MKEEFTLWEKIIYFIVGCAAIWCISDITIVIVNWICGK